MFILSKGSHLPVTHIIHIADTHIRTGDRVSSRAEEYRHVFKNLLNDIQKLTSVKNGTALMVIAGDVFHHKGRLETEGALVIYEWLNELLQLLPVLVICGNHDFRQEDPEYADMIEMLVAPYNKSAHKYPIHYMRDTGHYIWENIGFGLTTVKDTLKAYNTFGILEELPEFPNPNTTDFANVCCCIALFHGSICQSAMPNGNQMSEYSHGYPLEWFKGYDIAMLGDNHTQQLHLGAEGTEGAEGKLAWGYPGSLVQQDGGEPLFGHGYILWDIVKRSGALFHIYNEYGTVNVVRSKGDNIMVRLRPRETIPLTKALKMKDFPKNPQIRVIGSMGDEAIVESKLHQLGVKASRVYLTKFIGGNQKRAEDGGDSGRGGEVEDEEDNGVEDGTDVNQYITQLSDLNSPEKWKIFVRQNTPDIEEEAIGWLFRPEAMLIKDTHIPTTLAEKVNLRNKIIQQQIDIYNEKANGIQQQRHLIVLKHMEWEYLMCYGANNWFDFCHIDGKVALLNGKNASGKSSFIDVLCLAIFGDATTMRSDINGTKMSVKVIHDKKPTASKHDSAYVKLLFSVNNEQYEIKRSFTMKQKDEVLQSKVNKIATIHKIVDNTLVLIADGTTMVNDWMALRFGSLPEVLMSTILCQSDGSSFFMQKEEDQIRIIEKALHMETIQTYENILYEASKSYKYIMNELTTYTRGIADGTGLSMTTADEIENTKKELISMKEQLKDMEETLKNKKQIGNDLLIQIKGGVDDYGYDLEEAEQGLAVFQEKVKEFKDITPDVLTKAQGIKEKLAIQEKMLKDIPRTSHTKEEASSNLSKITKAFGSHQRRMPEDQPHITYAYIEEKAYEYNAWLNTIHYMEIDLDKMNDRVSILTKEQTDLYKDLENLQKNKLSASRPKKNYPKWQADWDKWSKFISNVTEMTVDELDQRTKVLKDYIKKIDEVRVELKTMTNRTHILTEEKADYKDMEFNEHCAACQKNPLRKRLEIILKELKELDTKRKKLQKKLASMETTENDYVTEIEELRLARPDRIIYETKVDMMNQENEEWISSMQIWDIETENEQKQKKIQADLKTIFDELNALQKIRVENDMWSKENQKIHNEKELLAEWKEWNDINDHLLKEKEIYENAIRWCDYDNEAENNKELLGRIIDYESTVSERDEWHNIVLSIKWQANWKEIEELEKNSTELKTNIASFEQKKNADIERLALINNCNTAIMNIQNRMGMLQKLISVFVGEKGTSTGFKAWIYNNEIIKLIQEEVNRFIAPLDQFKIIIRYHNGGMLYSLDDRGNCPTLDHASGYQRFLVGLAMRIALARIGAVGQNVRHLFIDEGFVACDSSNLLKVDEILKSMMEIGGYRSVLLMSHLDAIREVAQTRIDIQRSEDNVFSKIAWGVTYPVFEKHKKAEIVVSTTTKRGRLKKIS
jgi:DNA repair exonuclease SbcCD ATPase subunit